MDSEDLPLNISRETMQDRSLVEKLSRVITKRFLKFLDEEAKNRPEEYTEFYKEFGIFLKEGAALDFGHKEQLTKLLRFESSLTDAGKGTSLADYVSRMGADQKEIYYLVGPNRASIEAGPYLEGFWSRNLEVLFCYETVDVYGDEQCPRIRGKEAYGGRPCRCEALRAAEGRGSPRRRPKPRRLATGSRKPSASA